MTHGVLDELPRLGEGFDPRVAGPDEDEAQVALGAARVGVGEVERSQDLVAQPDRVGDVLEGDRVLREAAGWAACGPWSPPRSRGGGRTPR